MLKNGSYETIGANRLAGIPSPPGENEYQTVQPTPVQVSIKKRPKVMIAGKFFIMFGILLLSLIFLLRHYGLRLKKNYGLRLVVLLYFAFCFAIFFLGSLIRIYVFSHVGLDLTTLLPLVFSVGAWQGLPDQPTASSSSIHSVDQDELWKELEKREKAGPSGINGGRGSLPEPSGFPAPVQDDERGKSRNTASCLLER